MGFSYVTFRKFTSISIKKQHQLPQVIALIKIKKKKRAYQELDEYMCKLCKSKDSVHINWHIDVKIPRS